ncbi:HNH endonuclease [Nocardia sp. NPDC049190]|uniref:HNH endonuclease n=1 Tax=Bacillati TaxID=1783272 RepID=UPI0033C61C00
MANYREIWTQAFGAIPQGMVVDHINGDNTDNRLENLRLATPAQNMWNKSRSPLSKSGFPGVHRAQGGMWRVQVTANGVIHKGGKFSRLADAVAKSKEMHAQLHGEFSGMHSRAGWEAPKEGSKGSDLFVTRVSLTLPIEVMNRVEHYIERLKRDHYIELNASTALKALLIAGLDATESN